MPGFGLVELVIILVIVVALFGVGRLSGIGGALGKSIRDFRGATAAPAPVCSGCGEVAPAEQQFCGKCGTRLAA